MYLDYLVKTAFAKLAMDPNIGGAMFGFGGLGALGGGAIGTMLGHLRGGRRGLYAGLGGLVGGGLGAWAGYTGMNRRMQANDLKRQYGLGGMQSLPSGIDKENPPDQITTPPSWGSQIKGWATGQKPEPRAHTRQPPAAPVQE